MGFMCQSDFKNILDIECVEAEQYVARKTYSRGAFGLLMGVAGAYAMDHFGIDLSLMEQTGVALFGGFLGISNGLIKGYIGVKDKEHLKVRTRNRQKRWGGLDVLVSSFGKEEAVKREEGLKGYSTRGERLQDLFDRAGGTKGAGGDVLGSVDKIKDWDSDNELIDRLLDGVVNPCFEQYIRDDLLYMAGVKRGISFEAVDNSYKIPSYLLDDCRRVAIINQNLVRKHMREGLPKVHPRYIEKIDESLDDLRTHALLNGEAMAQTMRRKGSEDQLRQYGIVDVDSIRPDLVRIAINLASYSKCLYRVMDSAA